MRSALELLSARSGPHANRCPFHRNCASGWRRLRGVCTSGSDNWLDCPGADSLRIGGDACPPVAGSLFRLQLQKINSASRVCNPCATGRPLAPPLFVEIVPPKFPTPGAHCAFLGILLDELFVRAARLPFSVQAQADHGRATSWILRSRHRPVRTALPAESLRRNADGGADRCAGYPASAVGGSPRARPFGRGIRDRCGRSAVNLTCGGGIGPCGRDRGRPATSGSGAAARLAAPG